MPRENMDAGLSPYDEIPYPAGAYRQSHPARLETLAKLFGMDPPDIRSCRVLELGCADGSNLIPMACALPESSFVGIDLSGRQACSGREAVAALSLKNIALHHLDIRNVDESFGTFDYVIAHGIYSWVPPDVQRKILRICSERLCQNGVAYISYNTYPGWRMRGMLRDMMLYHSRKFDDSREQIEQARALIQWLSESVRAQNDPYGTLLRSELENMQNWPDTYFRHDSLEEFNAPVYFHAFVEEAGHHGLNYLAEAEFPMMLSGNCGSAVYETLERLGRDIVEMEQYMDFLRNRMFRQTLLCHASVTLKRDIGPWSLAGFHCAASIRPDHPQPEIASDREETFRGPGNQAISSREPVVKAALVCLAENWPAAISIEVLAKNARERLDGFSESSEKTSLDTETDRRTIEGALLTCFTQGLCELHLHPVPFTLSTGERPEACPWVRWLSTRAGTVTNRRHEQVVPDTFERQILPLLDGVHDREALVEELTALAQDGTLLVETAGRRVADHGKLKKIMATSLEEKLRRFERQALLTG